MEQDHSTYIVLLRGINVGGKHKLRMADLRRLCAQVGCHEVQTYIQSGNVVARADMDELTLVAALDHQLTTHVDFDIPVVVRTVEEMESVVEHCPFDITVDPTTLIVGFAPLQPADPLKELDPHAFGAELIALHGREFYLYLPDGQARSKLVQAIARTPMGALATVRNFRTVTKLLGMAAGTSVDNS